MSMVSNVFLTVSCLDQTLVTVHNLFSDLGPDWNRIRTLRSLQIVDFVVA